MCIRDSSGGDVDFRDASTSLCPSTGCTITVNGPDSNLYFLDPGDKLCLAAGAEYTGVIIFRGGTLENCADLPQEFEVGYNSTQGNRIINNGTIVFPNSITLDNTLTFDNHGTFIVNNLLNVRGNSIFNNFGVHQLSLIHISEPTRPY